VKAREYAVVTVTAAALAVLLTWPIAGQFHRAGRVDSGDGRFSVWNVAWVAHALVTNPWQLWDANIFHPHQNALAFSEANLVAGAMAVPVWSATENPYAAMNFVILCSFVLAAVTTFALVRRLTSSNAGAALAAFALAFCPFVFSHIPHVQLLMTFVLPLALLQMHRFVEAPTPKRAGVLGASIAFAGLACGYYGIFAGLMAGLGIVWFGASPDRLRNWRYWTLAAGAGLFALVLIGPFFAPYSQVQAEGFARTLDDARLHSVRWRSYLASPILLDRWMLPLIGTWREVLFPGFLSIAFAGIAVVRAFRPARSAAAGVSRPVAGFYLTVAALAFWASLGPNAGLYYLLHEALPFFSMIRAPARFGLLVTLALAVLAGLGLASVQRVIATNKRRWVALGVLAVALARSFVGPLPLAPAPPVTEAHRRLAALPWGPVVEFPFFVSAADRHRHTEYMLLSTLHWKPLLNGYSDHFPPEAVADMYKLASFPDADAWHVMRTRQARYVMVHYPLYDEAVREEMELRTKELPYLRLIVEDRGIALFEIVRWPRETN